MDDPGARELLRSSWLTMMPEWILAAGVSGAMGLAARHFGVLDSREALALTALPLVWAGARTVRWRFRTWTVTPDRQLIVRYGLVSPTAEVIDLDTVRRVVASTPPLLGWLNIGHVRFEAADDHGRRHHFSWTWMQPHDRLCEILEARGRLPIGRRAWWQAALHTAREEVVATVRWLARLVRRSDARDYGRFMAFCHHVLRAERGGRWPPSHVPQATIACWMDLLRRLRVVVSASNPRGWRLAGGVVTLDDIRRRLDPDDLWRAV